MAKIVMGLAFGTGLIQAAELALDPKSARLTRAAEFKFAENDSLKQPQELGRKFGEFLRENKFSAKSAIVGLPTQWLMLKGKKVPRTAAANLTGILLMQAERDFSLEPKDLVLDYMLCEGGNPATQPVLLAAALRERIDQIVTMLKAAGVSASSITSSALQLAAPFKGGTLLSVSPFGVELAAHAPGEAPLHTMLLSTTPEGTAWLSSAAGEVRRTLALRAADPDMAVQLVNGAGLNADAIAELMRALDAKVVEVKPFAGVETAGVPSAPRFAHAVALAKLADVPGRGELNFLDSKLVEKKLSALARIKPPVYAAALLAIALAGTLLYTWIQDSRERTELEKKAASREAEVAAAKTFLARYASAQGWYDKRPNPLEIMKELAGVIPRDGSAWIENLQVKEDMHCVLSMKAVDTKNYFEVFDAIEKADAFRDVKLVYMTQTDKKKSEVSYAISFVFWKQ